MSSIVLSIVHLASGALYNNVCDHIAHRLKYGDCADEKCRQLIVRELDEIKSKLDGLARKDLQSSVCFLKDGLCSLTYALEDTANDGAHNTAQNKLDNALPHDTGNKLDNVKECLDLDKDEVLPFRITESSKALLPQISIFDKTVALSPKSLVVTSKERFLSAKMSFEKAYSKATEAFNNEALGTTERILAAKLRVISKILECLEDPELSVAFCKLYLQQLHELPAVRKRFAVFFRSQAKSHLHKKKRVNNIRCVMETNFALYEYAKVCTNNGLESLSSWPKIKLPKRLFNPLLMTNRVLRKVEKCGLRSPNQFLFKEVNKSECVAVNSKGEVITKSKRGKGLEMFSNKGETVSSFCFDPEDTKRDGFEILALATDLDDLVYAVTRDKAAEDTFHYQLCIFDANLGRTEQQISLECLTGVGECHHSVCIAVDERKNIFVTKQDEAKLFILDSSGSLKNSFTLKDWNLIKHLQISPGGEIIAAELVGKTVRAYAEDGVLIHEIVIPGLHKVCGLAFDHTENTIAVLTEVLTGCFSEYRLESYSESGELLLTLVLPRQKENAGYRITSHRNGPLAVVHKTGVTFLHN